MHHFNSTARFVSVVVAALVLTVLGWHGLASGETAESAERQAAESKLAILWTSGDPDVAHRMTLMYANGAARQDWFDEVRLIVWGPSQRLVVGDKDVRNKIDDLKEVGVHVQACLACADSYGIADDLRGFGLEVEYMGRPLSEHLKSDNWHVLTF